MISSDESELDDAKAVLVVKKLEEVIRSLIFSLSLTVLMKIGSLSKPRGRQSLAFEMELRLQEQLQLTCLPGL